MPTTFEKFIEENGLSVRYKRTVRTFIDVDGPEKKKETESLEWVVYLWTSGTQGQVIIRRGDDSDYTSSVSHLQNETQEEARQRMIDAIKGSTLEIWQSGNKWRKVSVPADLC